jgi:hypothetical protein
MSAGAKAKRAKPKVGPLPREREPETYPCQVCGSEMTREYGSLMCSNKECPAWRGK